MRPCRHSFPKAAEGVRSSPRPSGWTPQQQPPRTGGASWAALRPPDASPGSEDGRRRPCKREAFSTFTMSAEAATILTLTAAETGPIHQRA